MRRIALAGIVILAAAIAAGLAIPRGGGRHDAQAASPAPSPPSPTTQPATDKAIPRIVKTIPKRGGKDVDPSLKEIVIVFDQDMAQGFSWTGGGPVYPKVTARPFWRDKRTCVLPVALERARFYRVGINSKSHRNFRSATGPAVPPDAIWFTTKGASKELVSYLSRPRVVRMTPANGAENVRPDTTELRVTFQQEMGGGFSWTGGGEHFPEITGIPRWSEDRKTCILPVKLKPNWQYALGLNSLSHKNFQNKYGVILEPVRWTFRTGP